MSLGEKVGPALQSLLPVIPIAVPAAAHFILVNFVLLSTMVIYEEVNWLPLTFLFAHIFFFFVALWTMQDKENIFPVAVFIFVVVVTALNDIIMLGLMFHKAQKLWGGGENTSRRTWQFSAGMMILNLLGKPLTVVLSGISIYFRTGRGIPGLNLGGGGGGAYQPVQGN